MAIPQAGAPFIDFGSGEFQTVALREAGPLVVVVWKRECPVCRMALPFHQRLALRYPGATVLGLSQNTAAETEAYCAENGITFPQVCDSDLSVTRAYDIDVVPTLFLTGQSGTIDIAGSGWDASVVEEVGIRLAGIAGVPAEPIVRPDDDVPAFRPG